MALSGSFETTSSHGRCLAFSFTATQDKVKATSKINYKLVGAGTAGGYVVSGNFKLVIDGQTLYSSAERIHLEKGTVVAQGSVTLTHDDKGERSFAVSAQAGIYDVAVNCRGSKTFTLNPIPRVSSVKGNMLGST